MATYQDGIDITKPAAADLSAYQFRFVSIDANGRGTLAGANGKILGILQNKPDRTDSAARIRILGVSKFVMGAAVNEGDYLMSNAQGFGTAAASLNDQVGAMTLTANGGSGDIMDVLLTHFRY